MREIRTYGLMRGCWPVRHRTAGWGLLDPSRPSHSAADRLPDATDASAKSAARSRDASRRSRWVRWRSERREVARHAAARNRAGGSDAFRARIVRRPATCVSSPCRIGRRAPRASSKRERTEARFRGPASRSPDRHRTHRATSQSAELPHRRYTISPGLLSALVLILALLTFAVPSAPQLSDQVRRDYVKVDAPVIALTNVRVIDGTGAPARAGADDRDPRRRASPRWATRRRTPVPDGATVIDLDGEDACCPGS